MVASKIRSKLVESGVEGKSRIITITQHIDQVIGAILRRRLVEEDVIKSACLPAFRCCLPVVEIHRATAPEVLS